MFHFWSLLYYHLTYLPGFFLKPTNWVLHRVLTIVFQYIYTKIDFDFCNISAISWRPVLVVEEERTTDHGQATGKRYHLRLRVECTLFCNLQRRARTHAVSVIGLYELLGIPTT